MNKYLSQNSWNKELNYLRDIKGQQESQQNVEPRKLDLTEYHETCSAHNRKDQAKERNRLRLKKKSHVLFLFTMITTGILAGSFILMSGILVIVNDKWNEVLNDPLFSVSSNPKNRNVKNFFQQSDSSFQEESVRDSIKRYAQLKADQKAKEIEKQKEENAFRAAYNKPKQCYSPETIEIKMRCINEYVRTRKRFSENYASNLASVNNNQLKVPHLNSRISNQENNN
jgi:hypothetical protein